MYIIYFILLIIFIIVSCISYKEKALLPFIVGCWLGMVVMFAIMSDILTKTVTAMDVYQGKTTIEYIIEDGEIIDSVVVFKDKKL